MTDPRQPPPFDTLLKRFATGDTDYELDLRSLGRDAAHQSVEHMLDKPFDRERTVAILLDAPKGDGVQSLFQPIGRHVKRALADGRLTGARPMDPTRGFGFIVTVPAHPEATETPPAGDDPVTA